jgi:hypothetical protein
VVEEIDAADDPVGRHLARDLRGQRRELVELHAEGERGLDAVLDAAPDDEHPLAHDAGERALVLEVVEEGSHADGEDANDQRDQDETDANPSHEPRPPPWPMVARALAKRLKELS